MSPTLIPVLSAPFLWLIGLVNQPDVSLIFPLTHVEEAGFFAALSLIVALIGNRMKRAGRITGNRLLITTAFAGITAMVATGLAVASLHILIQRAQLKHILQTNTFEKEVKGHVLHIYQRNPRDVYLRMFGSHVFLNPEQSKILESQMAKTTSSRPKPNT